MSSRAVVAAVLLGCAVAGAAEKGDLKAELSPERKKVLAGSKLKMGVILALRGADARDESSVAAVSISLVIDRSGSMSKAGKMEMVHVAGPQLVDRLESLDQLGIVAYSSDVEVERPMLGVNDSDGVKKLIRQLAPTSGTNLGGGLKAGIGQFEKLTDDGSVRRLLLLTDRLANEGETRPQVLARWAKDAFAKGTRVSAVGLGQNYNEELLKKIAHGGGGEFYYIEKKSQLPELFRKELEEGRTVVVDGLVVTVCVSDGCRFREIVGYPATGGTEKSREVRVGDLFAREKRTLLTLFDVVAPEDKAHDKWRAAVVKLAWKDSDGVEHSVDLPLDLGVTYLETDVADSLDPKVRARIIETENYRELDDAMELYRQGKREDALKAIGAAEKRIAAEKATAGDSGLIAQAGQLAQARREMEQRHDPRSTQLYNKSAGCFGYRSGGGSARKRAVYRSGGSRATESAVSGSHGWLAKHQGKDGSWDPAATGGRAADRQLATSLSLLAFLGAGHTESAGTHAGNTVGAVDWLIGRQQADGRIGAKGKLPAEPRARLLAVGDHAVAALALAEGYGMARHAKTGLAAQKAIDWLVSEKPFSSLVPHLSKGGAPTDDEIAAVGWCVFAQKSARVAGLNVPREAFAAAAKMLDHAGKGAAGAFAFGGAKEPGLLDTAVGAACRQMLGQAVLKTRPAVDWAHGRPGGLPEAGAKGTGAGAGFDWYYCYFCNLASFQSGGDTWRKWNPKLRDLMAAAQRKGGDEDGSWDPAGNMKERGRVITTALGTLYLEVYYRYLPIYR